MAHSAVASLCGETEVAGLRRRSSPERRKRDENHQSEELDWVLKKTTMVIDRTAS